MDFENSPFKGPFNPEDIIKQGKNSLPNLAKFAPVAIIVLILLIAVFSSFYSVGPDEVGIIRFFGKYVRTTNPGLHIKIPFGIEKVNNVKVKYIFKEEFGFRALSPGVVTKYSQKQYLDESLMLTGDLNVLVVEWIVQFKIKDPVKLLFNIKNPRETIRNISEAVMRQVVGDNSVGEVLTTRRVEINIEVQKKLQEILDSYNSGIQIVTLKLQDVNPPDPVKPSFNEVNEAKQEKEKVINEAWEAYNKAVPRAKGEAEKTIRKAEGYSLQRINKSKGDAAKFIATWQAYKDAKDVTRKRLYLETMQEVIPKAGQKYIIDPSQKGNLPLLNLNEQKAKK
ncbi:MAG: FtsH protease activity modulator HflK [Candidatus Omnitrophica bacterium]|nr:FtsH protease activity modulator HflK [Candidatus Omnitrophota bacterium]